MKRMIQGFTLALLAASCVVGCSRDELTQTNASPTLEPLKTADEYAAEAKQAWDALDGEEAIELCNKALQIAPDHIGAIMQRGTVWFSLSAATLPEILPDRPPIELENALRDFTRAAELVTKGSSSEAIVAVQRCLVSRDLGRDRGEQEIVDALNLCNNVLAKHPEDIGCLVARAQLMTTNTNFAAAITDLERAVGSAPDCIAARRLLSAHYLNAGALEKATTLDNETVRRFPGNPVGRFLQVHCLITQAKYEQALKACSHISADSKSGQITNLRYTALMTTGHYEKAIDCLLEALARAREPDNARLYYLLTTTCVVAENYHEAYKAVVEFQRLVPDTNVAALTLVATIKEKTTSQELQRWNIEGSYSRFSDTTPDQAVASVQKQLNEERPTAKLLTKCGVEYYRVSRFEEAITLFDRAIAMNPHSAEAYGRRGVTFHRLQQVEKANADFLESCRLDVSTNTRR